MVRHLGFREFVDDRLDDPAHILMRGFQLLRGGGAIRRQELLGHTAGARGHADRHIGILVGAHRHLQGAAADIHQQQSAGIPAIPTAGGQECQTRLVDAGQHGHALTDAILDLPQDTGAVRRLAQSGCGHGQDLADLALLGEFHAGLHRREQGLHAILADGAVLFEVLHQSHGGFDAGFGVGAGARRRVDDDHMNGVRADVQHAQARGGKFRIDHGT